MLWLDSKKKISTAIYFLALICDSTHVFFQIQDIFHYFRAFRTEILHIYSLIGQILKQLSHSQSVTSGGYLPSCASHLHFGDNCILYTYTYKARKFEEAIGLLR